MNGYSRDTLLAAAVFALIAAGALADTLMGSFEASSAPRSRVAPVVVATMFCPPPLRTGEAAQRIVVAAASDSETTLGIEGLEARRRELLPGRLTTTVFRGDAPPIDIVGYGGRVDAYVAGTIRRPVRGSVAAVCAPQAASDWYFPAGSTALNSDERLIVYNPFPEDAVVTVTLYGRRGRSNKANLADIPIAGGGSVGIQLNDFVPTRGFVSASVHAERGRVVVWKLLLRSGDQVSGAEMTLGASNTSDIWYFPEGAVGTGTDEAISVINPQDAEALVTVSLVSAEETVQPPKLVDVVVPPQSSRLISFVDRVGGAHSRLGGVGAIVRTTNGVPIVAERTLRYATESLEGVSSEMGATEPARNWRLGPASASPDNDALVVINADSEPVTLDVTLLQVERDPRSPGALQGIRVPPGGRFKVPLARWTGGIPMVALVTASGEIVAERVAYSESDADVGALMGTRI
ncbi:MAG TPA: DUF5719 family protein [Actinomycetota bacterium]|nr:DUF5719 family protein [Actinomycetota bacterium]